jgi:hypothetical protein
MYNYIDMSVGDLNSKSTIRVKEIFFGAEGTSLNSNIIVGFGSTISGAFSGLPSVTGLLRVIGKTVTLSFADFIATTVPAGGVINFTTKVSPPPFSPMTFPIWVVDSGSSVLGSCQIAGDGTITVSRSLGSPFTGSQLCGFQSYSVTYASF